MTNCTSRRHIRTQNNNYFLNQTKALYTEIAFWFRSLINGAWNVSFSAQFACPLTTDVAKVAGPRTDHCAWPERSLSMMQNYRQI